MVHKIKVRPAVDSDYSSILLLLRNDVYSAIYLYIDIIRYGLHTPFMDVYVEDSGDSNLISIIMKYNNTFQIYCLNPKILNPDIIRLIDNYNPSMVSGQPEVIHTLYLHYSGKYDEAYGLVLEQPSHISVTNMNYDVATLDDLKECSILACSDVRLKGYQDAAELEQQFIQRYMDHMGRHYVLRRENKIIAHVATYAEIPDMAVISGVIVHPDYRGNKFGKTLYSILSNNLLLEGKKVILFVIEKNIMETYLSYGAVVRSHYGKLTQNY